MLTAGLVSPPAAAAADMAVENGTPGTAVPVTALPYQQTDVSIPLSSESAIRRDDPSNMAVARACNGGVVLGSPIWWKVSPAVAVKLMARATVESSFHSSTFWNPMPLALVAADGLTVLGCSVTAASAAELSPRGVAAGSAVYVVRYGEAEEYGGGALRLYDAPGTKPANDTWQTATNISSLPFSAAQDTTLARLDPGDNYHSYLAYGDCTGFDSAPQPSVWFSYTPAVTERVNFGVSSDYSAHAFVVPKGPDGPTGLALECAETADGGHAPTDVLEAGVTYWVGVSTGADTTAGVLHNGGQLRLTARRPPLAPAATARSGAGVGQVSVSWRAPASPDTPITGYRVYGGTSASTLALLGSTGASTTSASYSYPDQLTPRFFAVTAVNAAGESVRSPVVSAVPRVGSSVYVDDAWIREGNSGAATGNFAIKLSQPSTVPVTLTYATANRAARAGIDYAAIPATKLTFAPGETVKMVTATVFGDTRREALEQFALNLSGVSGGVLADSSATGFVVDEEGPKSVRVADAYVTEGNSNTKALNFTVALSQAAETGAPVTVAYATADATALGASDYVATSGTVTFNAGESTKTVTVTVRGDTTGEGNESFGLNLRSVTGDGAVLADNRAVGTIINDDGTVGSTPRPGLSIADTSVLEGNSGSRVVSVPVTMSRARSSAVTVNYSTVAATAAAGSDFTSASGTITIPAGATTANVLLTVVGDTRNEGLIESLTVTLSSPSGADLADPSASVTLVDEEGPIFAYSSDTRVVEGNSGTRSLVFTLSLSAAPASGQPVNVRYATSDQTATTADADYTALTPGTLTFAAGQKSATVGVLVNGDTKLEPDETLRLAFSSPVGLVIADRAGTGRIQSDE